MDNHHRDVVTLENVFLHIYGGKRQDIAVSAHRREILKHLVSNIEADRFARIIDPDEEHPRQAVPRQIVGKCANGLPDFVAIRWRLLPLDAVRFQIVKESLKYRRINAIILLLCISVADLATPSQSTAQF
jgi:hypothetical protein